MNGSTQVRIPLSGGHEARGGCGAVTGSSRSVQLIDAPSASGRAELTETSGSPRCRILARRPCRAGWFGGVVWNQSLAAVFPRGGTRRESVPFIVYSITGNRGRCHHPECVFAGLLGRIQSKEAPRRDLEPAHDGALV